MHYLQRDGVTREGEQGRFYSTFSDDADGRAFLERGAGDRHQFRFIVSPEDGASFDTLRSFTRELMARMEQDLGTTLDWVAVDHFDTGHPHTHLIVRGATEDGKVLNIAGDYIARGIRGRASEILTRWLGPQSELEIREQLSQEIGAERLTKLDRDILARADDHVVDLRQPARWDGDGSYQQLLVSRARELERLGLAEREGPLAWRLAPAMEKTLTDLGRRGDIVRTMHRVMTAAKLDRRPQLYVIDRDTDAAPVVGKVIHRGAADDHHDRRYLVIDGVDGRTHYVEVGRGADETPIGSVVSVQQVRPALRKADRTILEIAHANGGLYSQDIHLAYDASATDDYVQAHVRRLEALRRRGAGVERQSDGSWKVPSDYIDQALEHEQRAARAAPVRIQVLAMRALEQEATTSAPSWLDRQLRGEDSLECRKARLRRRGAPSDLPTPAMAHRTRAGRAARRSGPVPERHGPEAAAGRTRDRRSAPEQGTGSGLQRRTHSGRADFRRGATTCEPLIWQLRGGGKFAGVYAGAVAAGARTSDWPRNIGHHAALGVDQLDLRPGAAGTRDWDSGHCSQTLASCVGETVARWVCPGLK